MLRILRGSRMGVYNASESAKESTGAEGRARAAFRGRSAGHCGRSVHGVFSRKRRARVDCQTSKAAIVKTQANGLMGAPGCEGMDPCPDGAQQCRALQQKEDGGINPPLQRQERRARYRGVRAWTLPRWGAGVLRPRKRMN